MVAESPTSTLDTAKADNDVGPPILFFDGVCGLCNRFVDLVVQRDRKGRIRLAPLQGETADSRLKSDIADRLDTVVLDDGLRQFTRSAAVVRVLWLLGGIWKILGGFLWIIPKPLRDLGYRVVASNRYRWFGRKETCRMPTAEERGRFLP